MTRFISKKTSIKSLLAFSDTFDRVYENALVVSQFERAAMIVSIENKLPSYWRKHHLIGNVC